MQLRKEFYLKKFNVEITETLRKNVVVEAFDDREAEEKVRNAWRKSEYILDADDFLEAGFIVMGIAHQDF